MSTKPDKKNRRKLEKSLQRAFVAIQTTGECERFLQDLCTPAELESFIDRWEVAQLVDQGIPYRQIQQATSVSTATITRVARALVHGSAGYRLIIERTQGKR